MLSREGSKNHLDHVVFRRPNRPQPSATTMRLVGSTSLLMTPERLEPEQRRDQEEPDRWDGGMT